MKASARDATKQALGTDVHWQALPMHTGDVAVIPKNTPHFFVNGGADPASALVVFTPPFDGPDQQPVPAP